MNDLIKRNYNSIVKRGLINEDTTIAEFITKLKEEVQEWIEAEVQGLPNANEELADIILVCLNFAKHFNIDIEKELNNKIEINEKR